MANRSAGRQVVQDLDASFGAAVYDTDPVNDEQQSEITLDSIRNSLTMYFPLRSSYSASWNSSAAFRELVQNWRDAIINSFKLDETHFHVVKEDRSAGRKSDIIFKAFRASAVDDCLGFIRFWGQDGTGTVEITNRNVDLAPKHLDFGHSEKRMDNKQAGTHGEGLKVALLVLLRENHRARCINRNFTWNFNFTTVGKLVARLSRMQREAVTRQKESAKGLKDAGTLPFEVSPYYDIRFFIGERGKGRDGNGESKQREQIKLEVFNGWCNAALFLRDIPNQEETIIKTHHGELILDEAVQGNLYLKGLLLKESTTYVSASISGRPLKYAYNFRHGETNRDRQSVTQSREECRAILNIWNEALQQRPDLIAAFHDMLLSTDPEYADVLWAKALMRLELAAKLRDHLFSDQTKWYYSDKEISEDPRLKKIIQGLGRTGSRLPDAYWTILFDFRLVHTAQKEQEDQFLKSRIAAVPPTKFAESLDKLLRSCIKGTPGVGHVKIEFVQAGQLHLHTYFGLLAFKIHERWLHREQVVEELGLSSDVPEGDVLFHAVQWLIREFIEQMPEGEFTETDDHGIEWEKRRVTNCAIQRLFEYINVNNSIALEQDLMGPSSKLTLEWNRSSSWAQEAVVNAQLHHKASCHKLRDKLLSKDFDTEKMPCKKFQEGLEKDVKPTTCFSMMVEPGLGSCTFENLNTDSDYFAVLLKQTEPDSIALMSGMCKAPRLPPAVIDLTLDEAPTPTPPAKSVPAPEEQSDGEESAASHVSVKDVSSDEESDDEEEQSPSYRAGDLIERLDILQPRDWYEAHSYDVQGAVIGIPKPEPPKGSKRKRESTEARSQPNKRVTRSVGSVARSSESSKLTTPGSTPRRPNK
ncbi:unnamed protein product [Clonostachys rosea]|uniref:Uncharacterized protein n=1 Tax=Bionectria ochroleuca TaxID=29856 RepID=A0ABY6U2P0_BIOOC|nr:unnamed protein product [Clonostachys rosea]